MGLAEVVLAELCWLLQSLMVEVSHKDQVIVFIFRTAAILKP